MTASRHAAIFEVHDASSVALEGLADGHTRRQRALMQVPGFLRTQRWTAVDNPGCTLVIYDVEHSGVLESPAYRTVSAELTRGGSSQPVGHSLVRYASEQILPGDALSPDEARGLLFLAMNIDPEHEEEFNRWNDTEHFPRLAAVDGVIAARRFRVSDGPHRYLAVYHAREAGVIDGPAWLAARETPWTWSIRPHTRDRWRMIATREQDLPR